MILVILSASESSHVNLQPTHRLFWSPSIFFLTNLHKLVGEGWPLVTIHTLLHHVLSLFADPVPPPVAESVPQPVIVHRGEDGAV